ncbi:hypothetical protein [Streptomyces sp. H27-H5]|uniref:hypothetical protein n=1 Tax=Streptomyces sp. H27-H5 TaxID=2996460 RepID=UPI002271C78C|nr:hypothetical protein [Streptomyces sp. H27-H5]MCY0959970.1 hypothetical protein [Streptomyces sp. H27-H5]
MAIGRLTHHAATVTLSSSNSASATIPNDGSTAVGRLLLVGCLMPSGSRTFAISGGAGAWASLGTAMQSGHMSQLWYRIAEVGDLGATITVTPSTGAIRQVLLLGSIAGVDQANPVAAVSNTSLSATTKTTPAASPASTVREVSVVWDSRGAATPQTSSWTAPAGQTRQGQAFTTSGSGACSGAWGDSDTTVSGTIGSRVWTADQSALGSAWTLSVKPAATITALGTVTEVSTAQSLTGRVTARLTTATANETARTVTGSKAGALPLASTVETARTVAGRVTAALSTAAETSTAQAATSTVHGTLGTAGSQETAQPATGRKTVGLNPAGVIETARPLNATVTASLTAAVEADQAQLLRTPGRLDPAGETDTAQSVRGFKRATLGTVIEVGTAGSLAGRKAALAGTAAEADTSLPADGTHHAALGTARETDAANALTGGAVPQPLNHVTAGVPRTRWTGAGPRAPRWSVGTPTT